MIATLLVTQGRLAEELYEAGRRIAGELPNLRALCLDWEDDLEGARTKMRRAISELDTEQGLLILADMYGSTPCNAALTFLAPGEVEVLAGVNLPMVVRLGCLAGHLSEPTAAADWLRGKAQKSICQASEIPSASVRCPNLGALACEGAEEPRRAPAGIQGEDDG